MWQLEQNDESVQSRFVCLMVNRWFTYFLTYLRTLIGCLFLNVLIVSYIYRSLHDTTLAYRVLTLLFHVNIRRRPTNPAATLTVHLHTSLLLGSISPNSNSNSPNPISPTYNYKFIIIFIANYIHLNASASQSSTKKS